MNASPREIRANVERSRTALWQQFIDARTNLIYDFNDPDRDRNLPTPEEIRKEIPNAAGWQTGFEDSAIAGGAFLDGLIRGYERTRDPELAEQARKIWSGLRLLGTASPGRGFVCRSVWPGDGRSHYPNSSADQYTLYCAALFRYCQSDLATAADRQAIAEIAVGICQHVLGANMNILRADGRPGLVGNVGLDELVDGQKVRVAGPGVLQYLALAATATGDGHWRQEYERARDAYDRLPLRRATSAWENPQCRVWILAQAGYLYRMLSDYETETSAREVYGRILRRVAEYSGPLLDQYNAAPPGIGFGPRPSYDWRKDHRFFQEINPQIPLDGTHRSTITWWEGRPGLKCELKCVREPMEGLTPIMLAGDPALIQRYAARAGEMLASLPVAQLKNSASLYLAETCYQRGCELGLWR